MSSRMFVMTRMWAMVTGLALAAIYFGAWFLSLRVIDPLPMLITAIGGFEMFLFAQDIWLKRKSRLG